MQESAEADGLRFFGVGCGMELDRHQQSGLETGKRSEHHRPSNFDKEGGAGPEEEGKAQEEKEEGEKEPRGKEEDGSQLLSPEIFASGCSHGVCRDLETGTSRGTNSTGFLFSTSNESFMGNSDGVLNGVDVRFLNTRQKACSGCPTSPSSPHVRLTEKLCSSSLCGSDISLQHSGSVPCLPIVAGSAQNVSVGLAVSKAGDPDGTNVGSFLSKCEGVDLHASQGGVATLCPGIDLQNCVSVPCAPSLEGKQLSVPKSPSSQGFLCTTGIVKGTNVSSYEDEGMHQTEEVDIHCSTDRKSQPCDSLDLLLTAVQQATSCRGNQTESHDGCSQLIHQVIEAGCSAYPSAKQVCFIFGTSAVVKKKVIRRAKNAFKSQHCDTNLVSRLGAFEAFVGASLDSKIRKSTRNLHQEGRKKQLDKKQKNQRGSSVHVVGVSQLKSGKPLVVSKRGRSQVLPTKFCDSVIQPWKRASRRRRRSKLA